MKHNDDMILRTPKSLLWVVTIGATVGCYASHGAASTFVGDAGVAEQCNGLDDDADAIIDEDGACPCPLRHREGSAFLFCEDALSWLDARDNCRFVGYELAAIRNASENEWLFDQAIAQRRETRWWFGYSDREREGRWQWSDLATSSYENWGEDEPNSFLGEEDCADLMTWESGFWNDDGCDREQPFICRANP